MHYKLFKTSFILDTTIGFMLFQYIFYAIMKFWLYNISFLQSVRFIETLSTKLCAGVILLLNSQHLNSLIIV